MWSDRFQGCGHRLRLRLIKTSARLGPELDPRRRILDELEARAEIVFALLFGSRAGGRPRPDSDWDVALFLHDSLDETARFRILRELSASLVPAVAVDLVVLNDAPPMLGHRALCGERLVVRDLATYVRYFVRTLRMSHDDAYFRRIHLDARLRRLAGLPTR